MKATVKQSKTALIAGVVALILLCSLSIGPAMSYFTANVQAQGGHTLKLGSSTEIHEKVVSGQKEVVIENTGDMPCYVRVKAFSGSTHPLEYSGEGWTNGGDGWWYADKMLNPKETTPPLYISITIPEGSTENFNVVVVHEATIVANADGTGGDWSEVITSDRKGA